MKDREDAVIILQNCLDYENGEKSIYPMIPIEIYRKVLKTAVEALKEPKITYCKDCAYYRTPERYSYKDPNPYCCRSALTKVSENDFCSKAIMKEGD